MISSKHILTGDFYIILLTQRNKSIIKFCVLFKIRSAVLAVICRMYNNIFRSENACNFNRTLDFFEYNRVICIVPLPMARKRSMRLIEEFAVAFDNVPDFRHMFTVIGFIENIVVILHTEHRVIKCVKACLADHTDIVLVAETH